MVEQSQEAKFGAYAIHNTDNVIAIPAQLNADLNAFYSSKNPAITGSAKLTVREWISTKSLVEQYKFGRDALINISERVW